jgi:hypothetical protein
MLPGVATEWRGPHTKASPLHVWGSTPAVARCRSAATSEAGGGETAVDLPLLGAPGLLQGAGNLYRRYGCTHRGSTEEDMHS